MVSGSSCSSPLGESWRDIEAETLDHFEIGIRQQLGPRLHGELTAFYDDGDNRYVIDPPPPPRYANLGAFRIRGAELTLNAALRDDLALFAGLTLLDTDPVDLPYAPETSVSLGANWQATPQIQLNLDAEYVSSMQVLSQARRFDAGVICVSRRPRSRCHWRTPASIWCFALRPFHISPMHRGR